MRPRRARTPSRRAIAVGAALALVVLVSAVVVVTRDRSHSTRTANTDPGRTTTSTWRPSTGLVRLVSGKFVAVAAGTVVAVDRDGSVRRLLGGVKGIAFVCDSSGDSLLVGRVPTHRIITSAGDEPTFAVPAGATMIPDARGRWWSDFGNLEGGALRRLSFPPGTRPLAHLRDGYLLAELRDGGLFEAPTVGPRRRLATGTVQVLAVSGDLVAWSDDSGAGLHVKNLSTGRITNLRGVDDAKTARFSSDGTRLAILAGHSREQMLLADTDTGDVIARLSTSARGFGVSALRNLPPALQPVPFSWDASSPRLLVVARPTAAPPRVYAIDAANGAVKSVMRAPDELTQLVLVSP